MNISPEIAMIVVSLVAHKLLAHHPTSGRDSNTFDLDDLLGQMNSGKIDPNILYQSGMVQEVSQRTGMSPAESEKALNTTLNMFSSRLGGGAKLATTAKTGGASTAKRTIRPSAARAGKTRK